MTPAERRATTALDRARQAVADLRQSIIDGADVSPSTLAEARAAVEIAELRLEGERRQAATPPPAEQRRRDASVRSQEARRRRAAEQSRQAERQGWQRAIDAGLDQATIADVEEHPHKYPAEFVEMLRRHRQGTGAGERIVVRGRS